MGVTKGQLLTWVPRSFNRMIYHMPKLDEDWSTFRGRLTTLNAPVLWTREPAAKNSSRSQPSNRPFWSRSYRGLDFIPYSADSTFRRIYCLPVQNDSSAALHRMLATRPLRAYKEFQARACNTLNPGPHVGNSWTLFAPSPLPQHLPSQRDASSAIRGMLPDLGS